MLNSDIPTSTDILTSSVSSSSRGGGESAMERLAREAQEKVEAAAKVRKAEDDQRKAEEAEEEKEQARLQEQRARERAAQQVR